jgi:hypothetical protein
MAVGTSKVVMAVGIAVAATAVVAGKMGWWNKP